MTTCDFAKSDTAKFILRSKKGTPKVALPSLPVYIVVPPPRRLQRKELLVIIKLE